MDVPQETEAQFARNRLALECETMKQLLSGLLDAKGRVAEEVHAIRKLGKSLRGGFSLFGLEKSAALEIQAIGRLLSGSRDAVSRLKTWTKLEWNADAAVSSAIAGMLEQQTHSAARRPPPETMDWCIQRVDAAREELHKLPTEDLAKTTDKGLRKLEKRALKRCKKLDHRAEEDFHEARKAVKAWLGAVGFLPHGTVTVDPKLLDLAELLGDENDLATLGGWLDEHGFTARFAPDLWKTLNAKRRGAQAAAIDEARKLASPKTNRA